MNSSICWVLDAARFFGLKNKTTEGHSIIVNLLISLKCNMLNLCLIVLKVFLYTVNWFCCQANKVLTFATFSGFRPVRALSPHAATSLPGTCTWATGGFQESQSVAGCFGCLYWSMYGKRHSESANLISTTFIYQSDTQSQDSVQSTNKPQKLHLVSLLAMLSEDGGMASLCSSHIIL